MTRDARQVCTRCSRSFSTTYELPVRDAFHMPSLRCPHCARSQVLARPAALPRPRRTLY